MILITCLIVYLLSFLLGFFCVVIDWYREDKRGTTLSDMLCWIRANDYSFLYVVLPTPFLNTLFVTMWVVVELAVCLETGLRRIGVFKKRDHYGK